MVLSIVAMKDRSYIIVKDRSLKLHYDTLFTKLVFDPSSLNPPSDCFNSSTCSSCTFIFKRLSSCCCFSIQIFTASLVDLLLSQNFKEATSAHSLVKSLSCICALSFKNLRTCDHFSIELLAVRNLESVEAPSFSKS